MSRLQHAESLLRAILGEATRVLGEPDVALDRLPRDPVPELAGAVTSGWAARLPVRDGRASLDVVGARWRAAGWTVTRTPVAVLGELDGLTVSLVLDVGGRTGRLSGGTPPLPGEPDRPPVADRGGL